MNKQAKAKIKHIQDSIDRANYSKKVSEENIANKDAEILMYQNQIEKINTPFGPIEVGDRFYNFKYHQEYIVAEIGDMNYILIDIENGRRYTNASKDINEIFGCTVDQFERKA